jgi:DNA polymerase-3 subunit epsilon
MKPARPVASDQLGFGFEEPSPAPVSPAKPTAKKISPAASSPRTPSSDTAADGSAEAMARTLEAHPDYRVLRRLVPRLVFPAATGPVATLLVLDTETTGLNAARDKVVELALLRVTVDLATGQPVGAVQVYDGLEDPGMPMPPEITVITGITDEMLRGQALDQAQVLAMSTGRPLKLVPGQLAARTSRQMEDGRAAYARVHFDALKRMLARDEPEFAD